MSASPAARSHAAVVNRLRAAGCVFAEAEAQLLMSAAKTAHDLAEMLDRRVAGLPLEHILGWVEFCGLRIAVDPAVFVPRRRTEFLVGQAADVVGRRSSTEPPVVVDLCCGTGAVGVALAAVLDRIELYAVDLDPAAARCARRNLADVGGRALVGDLYDPLPVGLQGSVDVLLANAPYVPSDAIGLMPPEARLHEARVALDGGTDGLDVARRVVAGAAPWLAPTGALLIETSDAQSCALAAVFAGNGLSPTIAVSEEVDATVVIGIDTVRISGR